MNRKTIKFGDTEIEKHKFYQHKSPILSNNIDINEIVVSNKISFDKKYFKQFIGYKDGKKVKPACILLPKTCSYRRDFNEIKYIFLLIKDDKLLEKYNEIWDKINSSIKKVFDSGPA